MQPEARPHWLSVVMPYLEFQPSYLTYTACDQNWALLAGEVLSQLLPQFLIDIGTLYKTMAVAEVIFTVNMESIFWALQAVGQGFESLQFHYHSRQEKPHGVMPEGPKT